MSFALGRRRQAVLEEQYDRWLVKTAPVTQEAAEQDIVIEQGRRFYLAIEWREFRGEDGTEAAAVDPADWTLTLRVAREYGGDALLTIVGAIATEDGNLVEFVLAPAATAALTGWSLGVYDVLATQTGNAVRLLRGTAALSPAAAGS